MPNIELGVETLISRGGEVRDLLRPLTRKEIGPAWQPISQNRAFIIGTHDGSPPTSNYRDWRFSTYVPNIRAMYFELWRELDKGKWYLNRSYLTLYKTKPQEYIEEEIICLHCDPNEPDDAPHSVYKRGPHFHIKGVKPHSLDHSHIALQHEKHLGLVLHSCDELTMALSWGIRMIKEEILELIYDDLISNV